MRSLFLDESGEFGFHAGSSKFQLIALLETNEPKRLTNIVRKEKLRLHKLGWPPEIEIKGTSVFGSHRNPKIPKVISDNRVAHALRIVSRILEAGATPHYSIVRKSKIKPNLRNAPYGIAYNYFTGCVLCKIHNQKIAEPLTLVVDQRNKETHAHMPFDGYVMTRVITDCNHEHPFDILHEESHKWLGLQAVDFISWGLFRHHEHNDSTFYNVIHPKLGICDNWYA